ncbi:MAG: GNAT family N-acetyltransferase [Lachnotalea sp.]
MEMKIELGQLYDIDEVETLYNDLNDALDSHINYPGWMKGVYPVREDAQKGIQDKSLFVARLGSEIVGSIILSHEPEQGYDTVKWLCNADYLEVFVIRTLVVHPLYAKQGIGQKLMLFAEEQAHSCKMKSIRLDVFVKNMPAISLYEQCGYHYLATIDEGLSQYGLDWFRVYEKLC